MYYLGIDLGGTNVAVGIVDETYKLIAKHSVPTSPTHDFETIVCDMANAAKAVAGMANVDFKDIHSVGIGVPSSLDPANNHVVFANNLDWYDVDLVSEFKKHIDKETYIANDADCAAFGEALSGAAKGLQNVVMITLGTGVGGGVILNGKIFTGGTREGLELGHIGLVINGEPCTCGRRGCLETYASVTALVRDTVRAIEANKHSLMYELCGKDLSNVSAKLPFKAALQGDETAKVLVKNFIRYLAEGIQTLTICFRPDAIIIGGGICNEGENLLTPLREEVTRISYAPDLMIMPKILRAELSNDAGIIGAALLYKGLN